MNAFRMPSHGCSEFPDIEAGKDLRMIFGGPRVAAEPEVQPKLTLGAVGDPYEREADRIADRVTGSPYP